MQSLFRLVLIVMLALPVLAPEAVAEQKAPAITDFFGTYEGETITGGLLTKRDLNIKIEAYKKQGFTISWTTILERSDGTVKRKSFSINFNPAKQRPGFFRAAMGRNVFGHDVPLDPLKQNQPYVWASLLADTLTLHALYITEDGGYEIQVFDRTLTETGLKTHFARFRDGEQLKVITGELKKVAN